MTIPELRQKLKSATPEQAERIAQEIIEKRKRESVRKERENHEYGNHQRKRVAGYRACRGSNKANQ